MLKDYPIYFDSTKLFEPTKWEESYDVVETTVQTEAGTDEVIVIRNDKLSVSASFQCTSKWAATFAKFRDKASIQVKAYDLKSQDYKTRKMRMRNFKPERQDNSDRLKNTNGLYTITFDLEEF